MLPSRESWSFSVSYTILSPRGLTCFDSPHDGPHARLSCTGKRKPWNNKLCLLTCCSGPGRGCPFYITGATVKALKWYHSQVTRWMDMWVFLSVWATDDIDPTKMKKLATYLLHFPLTLDPKSVHYSYHDWKKEEVFSVTAWKSTWGQVAIPKAYLRAKAQMKTNDWTLQRNMHEVENFVP